MLDSSTNNNSLVGLTSNGATPMMCNSPSASSSGGGGGGAPNAGPGHNSGNYGSAAASSYKIQRQQANVRERKRIQRSAPTGYTKWSFPFHTLLSTAPPQQKTNDYSPLSLSLPFSCALQFHQLRLRWVAGSCAHIPVWEAPQQNRHTASGHCLHIAATRGSADGLRSTHLCGEVSARRNQSGSCQLEY